MILKIGEARGVIDTITPNAILIPGCFTDERKVVLDAAREGLRARDYLPVLLDFEKQISRDLTETISTLARMSWFTIADVMDARRTPKELQVNEPAEKW